MGSESDKIRKIRRKLPRKYGCEIYERDFNLAVRFPLNQIKDLTDEDMELVRESLEIMGIEEISDKTVSAYLIADRDHLEVEVELFLGAVEEGLAAPVLETLALEESQKKVMIDNQVRRMIQELSRKKHSKSVTTESSGAGKVKESYTLGGRGRVVGYRPGRKETSFGDVALVPTIRKAIQGGSFDRLRGVNIKKHHIQEKIYRSRTRTNLCVVADTSFFPDDVGEIGTLEWIIRTILTMAYEKRYHVAMVSFSGNRAEVEMPFTTDVDKGGEVLESFEFGGLSPLASGFKIGYEMLEKQRGDRAEIVSLLVLLTSGKANVPLYPGGFLRRELIFLAERVRNSPVNTLIAHIGEDEEHQLKEISFKAGARYYRPPLLESRSDMF